MIDGEVKHVDKPHERDTQFVKFGHFNDGDNVSEWVLMA